MTTEPRRTSFKPYAFLAAFGLALAFLLSPANSAAGGFPLLSSATVTGIGGQDQANAVARDGAGNLFVVGFSSGPGAKDIWVSRWNEATLTVISTMTLNGTGNGDDGAQGVAVDGSGNVYVTGVSSVAGAGSVLWMGKFSNSLVFISSAVTPTIRLFPNPTSGAGITIAPNGNLYVVNNSSAGGNSNIVLAEYNTSLVFLASATFFNGFNANFPFGVTADPGGNIYVSAAVAPAALTSSDIWFGKFSPTLVFITSATRAGGGGNSDQLHGAGFGSDGNLYVTGSINNSGVVTDTWLAKYSPNLVKLNEASFASPSVGNANGDAIVVTGNRLYVAGSATGAGQGDNAWLGEFDYSLTLLSSMTFNSNVGVTADLLWGLAVDTTAGKAYVSGYVTPSGTQKSWVAKYLLPTDGVQVTAVSTAPASVDGTSNYVPILYLDLTSVGNSYSLGTFTLNAFGDVPAVQLTASMWRDNGDGMFSSGSDSLVASAQFIPPGGGLPMRASLNASGEAALIGGTTRYYFVVSFNSVPPTRKLTFGFQLGADVAVSPSNIQLPFISSPTLTRLSIFAKPINGSNDYATPVSGATRSGGLDTGLFVQSGQRVHALTVPGAVWNVSTTTNADGGAPFNEAGSLGAFNRGALVGRVGSGPWQLLGQASTITATSAGALYVAPNDADYSDNSGSIAAAFDVLAATFSKVWVGGTLGFENSADVAQNWIGGRPFGGESVVFGPSAYDCNWNLPNLSISSLTITTGFTKTVRLVPTAFGSNNLEITGDATIQGGAFVVGRSDGVNAHSLVVKGKLVVRDTSTFDVDGGALSLGIGLEVRAGAIMLSNTGAAKFNRAIPSLAYYMRVDHATMNVTSYSYLNGIEFLEFIDATVTAFDNADFTTIGTSTNPYSRFISAAPVSYVFNDWNASPPARNIGVFASGLAGGSTVTFNHSTAIGSTGFGTPHTVAAPQTVFWNPDGGGASGTISGTLSGSLASYLVVASTAPNGVVNTGLGGGGTASQGLGLYSLSPLRAPGTYYVMAYVDSAGNKVPFSPAGGFGHPGIYQSDPVFVPAGGTTNGINLTLDPWGEVDGTIVNNSSQNGPIIVETWQGPPNVVTSTRQTRGAASPNYSFATPATNLSVYRSSSVFAFVDANRNTVWDAFEASGTVTSVNVSSFQATFVATITISGGNIPPGGTVALTTAAVHPGAVGATGPGAMIRSHMIASAGPAELSAIKVRFLGSPLPPPGATFGVWLDDGDGSFNPLLDTLRGSEPILTLGPSTYTVFLTTPVFISTFAARDFFLTLDVNSNFAQPTATAGAMIDSATSYTLSIGTFSTVPPFPVQTGVLPILSVVDSKTEATSDGQGGAQAGGTFFFTGQMVSVISTGSIRVSPTSPLSGPGGQPGTTGLNTVLPAANLGELIGRVSNGGDPTNWIRIGTSTAAFAAVQPGVLRLAINDFIGAYSDNQGSLLAGFTTSGSSVGVITGSVFYPTPANGTLFINAHLVTAATASFAGTTFVPVGLSSTVVPFTITGLSAGQYDLYVTNSLNTDFGRSGPAVQVNAGSTSTLNATMYQNSGSISGNISYAGVQNYGSFQIGVATVTDFSGDVYFYGGFTSTVTGSYNSGSLPGPATYYVVAYRDGDGNSKPSGPEPLGYYGAPGGGLFNLASFITPIFINGTSSSNVNFSLLDMGAIEGVATLLPGATGALVVEAGRGIPGAPGYTTENRVVIPNFAGAPATGGLPFSLGLLRPATNYSLFAFLDKNNDGQPSGGEQQFTAVGAIAAPSGGRGRQDFSLISLSSPAAPATFTAAPLAVSTVAFAWNLVPGATGYQLRRANGTVILSLGSSASVYLDVLLDNTSSQIRSITASNGNGTSTNAVLAQAVYSSARIPGNPFPTAISSTGTLTSWTTGGNSVATVYELQRSSSLTGSFATVFTGTSTSFLNPLVPAATYFWQVRALNGNGIASSYSGTGNVVSLPQAGPALSGLLFYTGSQTAGGRGLVIEASTSSATFFPRVSSAALPGAFAQPWYLPVAAGTYFLRAYVDIAGNGSLQPSADRGQTGPFTVSVGSVSASFAVLVDTVPPGAPAGVVALSGNKQVTLTWAAPTKNANGTNLLDLGGFVVERASAATAGFQSITATALSSTTASYVDSTPPPGVPNYYRVRALDLGGNQSSPSGAVVSVPSSGGSISGQIRSFSSLATGQYRVRLSTSAAPSAVSVAEAALTSYTFTGLADGAYYLRAFRDVNGNGVEDSLSEPAGTFGGLNQPFPISIVNGNAVSGADATICDRSPLNPPSVASTLLLGGCPALDKGPGFLTALYAISVGGGASGSLGVGTQVNLSFSTATTFATDLILLGPDGNVFGRDNRVGGANLTATLTQPGIYLAEPTSFLVGSTGTFVLNLRLSGGFAGVVSTTVTYSGAQGGNVYAQLFNSASSQASPILKSSSPAPGSFTFPGLPDGTYYLRAFRDANGNGVRDNGEPSGQFGVSNSSPLPVVIVGGLPLNGPFLMPVSDPAVGLIKGAALYDGTASGLLRVEVGHSACGNCSAMSEVLASTTVVAGSIYTLPFVPSATDYIVRAFVDSNGNGTSDALESTISTFPITVFVNGTSTVSLVIKDGGSGQSGSAIVNGVVNYSGSSTGPIVVGLSRDASFHNIDYLIVLPAPGNFTRAGLLGDTSYYMSGFMDLNYNNSPDPDQGEPVAAGSAVGYPGTPSLFSPPAIFVQSNSSSGVQLNLSDPPNGGLFGTVRYAGGSAATNLVVQASPVTAVLGNGPATVVIPRAVGVSTYAFHLNYLSGQSYYINAFADANNNGRQDFGEPFGGRQPVGVSAGTGTFPTYGADLEIFDPGALGASLSAGRIRGDLVYLGTQSGDIFVRFFNNSGYKGTPLYTLRVTAGTPGSGEFTFDMQNLPFDTYYLDAFRDPTNAGAYNPRAHAHGVLNNGQSVTVSQDQTDQNAFGGSITDPGQGGSVNAFTGSFAAAGGARFDGGATDLGATIAIDTTSAGAPQPVVLGVTAQNGGIEVWGVRYSSTGAKLSSAVLVHGDIQVSEFVVANGDVYIPGRIETPNSNSSTGTLTRYNPSFLMVSSAAYGGYQGLDGLAHGNSLYATSRYLPTNTITALKINDSTLVIQSSGTFVPPGSCNYCSVHIKGAALSPNGAYYVVFAVVNQQSDTDRGLHFLLKFDASTMALLATKDVTSLGVSANGGGGGASLGLDNAGNLYLAFATDGNTARTYKFDVSGPVITQQASTSYGPIQVHFSGGLGNLKLDPASGQPFEVWESTTNAGDYMLLHYDSSLVLRGQRFFDGGGGEDTSLSLGIFDSSNVFVTGAVNNGVNLDWGTVKFNGNGSGSSSGAGVPVVITTSNANNYIAGSVTYTAGLISSGTFRVTLTPYYDDVPIRFATAPFGAAQPFLFNNVPDGRYDIRAFADPNGNSNADAGEPTGSSTFQGIEFSAADGSQDLTDPIQLCDRRPIAFDVDVVQSLSATDCTSPDRTGAPHRLYTFYGTRGQPVTIYMKGVGFYDTLLDLYDPSGQIVDTDDESGGNGDALITNSVLPEDGLYTIDAQAYASASFGQFRLSLTGSAGALGGISGAVDYSGQQGGAVIVGLFNSPTFSSTTSLGRLVLTSTRAYSFTGLAAGTTYYLGAFIDVNANNAPDPGEDGGSFGVAGVPSPILLAPGQVATGVQISVAPSTTTAGSASYVTGTASYTGLKTGQFIVEFWSNSQFTGHPVASRVVPTGVGAYDATVPGGVPYYVRGFLDANNDFLLQADEPRGVYAPKSQGAAQVFATAGQTSVGVDFVLRDPGAALNGAIAGEGTAVLSSTFAVVGKQSSMQIVYTVGANGISSTGSIGFTAPPTFTFPQANFSSSVTVTSTATAFGGLTFSGPSVFVSPVTALVAGQQVVFKWNTFGVPCVVGTATITVSAAQNGNTPAAPLFLGSPSLAVVPGAPAYAGIVDPYFSFKQGELTEERRMETYDVCGNRVAVGALTTVTLFGRRFNGSSFVSDPEVGVTTGVVLSTGSSVAVDFAIGQSSTPFFVFSVSTGFKYLEVQSPLSPYTSIIGIQAMPSNALTGVSVSSYGVGTGLSSATIALGANGQPTQVFVNFTLGDPQQPWHVIVSSLPFKSGAKPSAVWDRFGYGQPNLGEIAWDGRFLQSQGGSRVPNGLYYVRVEVGYNGGVKDDTARVFVSLPQFTGRAFDPATFPNTPLSAVQMRVYGPTGYFTAATASDGSYVLPGLGAGSYRVNLTRTDYADGALDATLNAGGSATSFVPRTLGLAVSSNATGGLDFFLTRSPRLTVVPSLDPSVGAAAADQWGSLQVRPSTASAQASTFYGPMRLKGGTTTFDDGGQWDSSTLQFIAKTELAFNVPAGTYTVVADLSGYSRSTGSVYVGPDGARLDLTPFLPKAVINGTVSIPAPAPATGISVGITATALSTAVATTGLSGSAFVNGGQTSAAFSISGFDPGAYLLRANTQGLSAVTTGPIVVNGTATVSGIFFSTFGAGASITGTITAAAPNGTQIFVNAWSPGSFNFGSTVVYVNGGSASYAMPGLDAGATYQLYANINAQTDYDVPGGFPRKVIPPAVDNFTFFAASGVVSGTIILPAGDTDFTNVSLFGLTIASLHPDEVGHTFVQVSTSLPNFLCGNGASGASGYCPAGVSSATFRVQGVNTQTIDARFLFTTTGQSTRHTLSIVNGSTVTVLSDLRASTFSISGSLVNQIADPLFNSNDKILANAPYIQPQNWPLGVSSSTARVIATRQEIDSFGVAISTVFDPFTSRIGFLDASGNFSIPNCPNGAYVVRTADLRSCATCAIVAPAVGRSVTVSGASVSSVTLTVSNGYSVSGTISLDGGMLDAQIFSVLLLNKRQEVVRSTFAYLGDVNLGQQSGSVDYAFPNLPPGDFYTLTVVGQGFPIKYAGRPVKFPDPALSPTGLQSNLTSQNALLQRAAYLTGRLKDGGTGELIGKLNATLLAPNFSITATANPWIEGGFSVAAASVSARPIQDDGYFRVGPLVPDVSYDLRLAQATWDPNFLASGSQNYAPITIGGLKPTPGEIRDIGVIALGQGQSVSGVVRSTTTGLALGNIKVTARPSFGGDDLVVQTYTNGQGAYSLWVSSAVSNQFSLIAAPRGGNQASDGKYYGTVSLSNVNLQTQTSANFLLTPLTVVVTGQISVATGEQFSYPFGDKRGFPAAAINLQPLGVVPANPLGDIEAVTDQSGNFSVPGLSTGVYSFHATSLGYAVYNATVSVIGSSFSIFTASNTPAAPMLLSRGATATGRIIKSDGTSPNSSEVVGVAAANFGAGEFVVGSVETDPVAKTVNAYTVSGFKPGIAYNIVLLSGSKGKEVSFPPEGAGVVFTAAESSTTKTINLTYRPATLDCLGTAKALDAARTQFSVQIDCLKPLRQQTAADDDLTQILTLSALTSGGSALPASGQLTSRVLSTDRRRLTGLYAVGALETRFSMRVRASAAEVNPATGDNFSIDKVFDFYAGLDSSADGRASNINGGFVGMNPSAQDELLGLDERSGIVLPPGAFGEGSDALPDSSVVAQPTTTVNVSMTKGRDQQLAKALSIATLGYAPAALQVADVPSAFPNEMWAAMSQYRTLAGSTTTVGGANPLSAFYSIFLPAGIRHQLKQSADLTLSYNTATSTSTTDDKIQVWFYNAVLGRFVLENTNRRLDSVNKTVTVSVNHFSTFVVLDSTPTATSTVSFGGADIAVANFPNPADCITHSNIARNSTLFGSGGVHQPFVGTMFRASIPLTGANDVLKYNIYTVAGEKIRTIDQGAVPAGQTYYTPWNCTNDNGRTVASGVYIGEVIHGGRRKFFKIAIIKGSGL